MNSRKTEKNSNFDMNGISECNGKILEELINRVTKNEDGDNTIRLSLEEVSEIAGQPLKDSLNELLKHTVDFLGQSIMTMESDQEFTWSRFNIFLSINISNEPDRRYVEYVFSDTVMSNIEEVKKSLSR